VIFTTFFDFFKGYSDCYTIIGGNAASILLKQDEQKFRLTRDYDIVVLFENISNGFSQRFMEFVEKYDYSMDGFGRKEDKDYYRFVTKNELVPKQIELFSRRPVLYDLIDPSGHKTPLHFEDGPSLSAIVLDDDYYHILKKGIEKIKLDGEIIPVLNSSYLILFKARAHLDIQKRILEGIQVQRVDKTKHFKDVCRLTTLKPDGKYDISIVPKSVQEDLKKFIGLVMNMDETEFDGRFKHVEVKDRPIQEEVVMVLNSLLVK